MIDITLCRDKSINSLEKRINELENNNKILHDKLLKNIPLNILTALRSNELVKVIAIDNEVSDKSIYEHRKLYNLSLLTGHNGHKIHSYKVKESLWTQIKYTQAITTFQDY